MDYLSETREETTLLSSQMFTQGPHISWKDKVTNVEVLTRAGLTSIYTLLRQRRLRWLGHVSRMDDGRIPKDILYSCMGNWHQANKQLGIPS